VIAGVFVGGESRRMGGRPKGLLPAPRAAESQTTVIARTLAGLDYARGARVLAIACDMPYVTGAMLARLASYALEAAAVAPHEEGVWSPLFARYDSSRVAAIAHRTLASGTGAMHAVLEACDARELPLSGEERANLRDWDSPNDMDERTS
jgi:molybdopterin-guanine dinucleotide biosynthesis protein A